MELELKNITKQFYNNIVLNNVNIAFSGGKIHALVGENGAGKSTLIKIIGGAYRADRGQLFIDGKEVKINSAQDASKYGINIVFQEYNLIKNLTVLENIMLGKEIKKSYGAIDMKKTRELINKTALNNNIKIDLEKFAGDLSSAEAKTVEILKACINEMKFLILDEPSAALDDEDVGALFSLIENLRACGIGIIYVSHRLEEIFKICDTVSVLKDGCHIGTWAISAINQDFLIDAMVGRKITDIFPLKNRDLPESSISLLEIRNLSDREKFHNINLTVYEGEILGIGGMSGHGQREFIRALYGIHPVTEGEILLHNRPIRIKSPSDAIEHGFVFLSDDRRNEGLALEQSVMMNITCPSFSCRSSFGIISKQESEIQVDQLIARLNIKLNSISQAVQGLSGGNQQRVVLAKWLPLNPQLMLFHEPTLGVDVGAKMEIYEILRNLTRQSISIIMVTSDMMELLGMSDRICVFYEGRISAMISGNGATEEQIMAAAVGKPRTKGAQL